MHSPNASDPAAPWKRNITLKMHRRTGGMPSAPLVVNSFPPPTWLGDSGWPRPLAVMLARPAVAGTPSMRYDSTGAPPLSRGTESSRLMGPFGTPVTPVITVHPGRLRKRTGGETKRRFAGASFCHLLHIDIKSMLECIDWFCTMHEVRMLQCLRGSEGRWGRAGAGWRRLCHRWRRRRRGLRSRRRRRPASGYTDVAISAVCCRSATTVLHRPAVQHLSVSRDTAQLRSPPGGSAELVACAGVAPRAYGVGCAGCEAITG